MISPRLLPLSILWVLACWFPANADEIQFDRDIRPILSDKCFFCHGPDAEHREADLRFDLKDDALAMIDPEDPEASELIQRIKSHDDDEVMPPPSAVKQLTEQEIKILDQWVKQGAPWSQHWSFVPPVKSQLPESDASISEPDATDAIDAFVSARLAEQGQPLAPEATREKLLRRITYDLTGMPPTIAELDAFLGDDSENAYETVVDRLLASPRYGQRMALAWLDVARYGDTSVYHADGTRDMWAWRDAIVEAYNENLPFDQFSKYQLAGDLLPDATLQQKILSGFNRNNGTTDEGGAIAEEYRVEYAVDRVKTTATAWLGLTMECAQCHDHKYDPISQEEYYQFYAFFNVSRDGGMQTRNGNAEPKLNILDPEKEPQIPAAEKNLAAVRSQLKLIDEGCDEALARWVEQRRADESEQPPVGLIAELPILTGQGETLVDLIDGQRPIQLHGKYKWVDTLSNKGLRFDGDGHADLGNIGDFERTDSFSYGGWIETKKNGSGALLARMNDANAHRGYDVLAGKGPISVHLINTWPTNAIKVTTNKSLDAEKRYHVMVTYDGSSKASGVKIYVNGEEWDWKIEQDRLSDTIRTEKTLLIGSRHDGAKFHGTVDSVQVYQRKLESAEVDALAKSQSLGSLLEIAAEDRTKEQAAAIRKYYLTTANEAYQAAAKQETELAARLDDLKRPITSVMIMSDLPQPRETFVLNRGAYDSPTETKVTPGIPAVLPPMAKDLPRNRLGMAEWLFQNDHPLTARVTVNRYWQMLFGMGLVASSADFGAQGEFPSHPELLDWLAVDFREHDWDTKRLIKQIVMSRTYRQSSRTATARYSEDPQNRWLGRGPRFRLQGEFIRDTALTISGLLVDQFGGPGVKPYQPPGLWAEVGLGGNPKFVQDQGDKLYRRSLYTYWKRSAPPPAMQIFDAPTREKCTVRRARTNTPLQALVTLNDVQFVEAARHFAKRMMTEAGETAAARIELGFRLATSRRPAEAEQQVLLEIYDAAIEKYKSNPDAAIELLSIGDSPRDEALDPATHAAWTIVASSILNLDETLTRE